MNGRLARKLRQRCTKGGKLDRKLYRRMKKKLLKRRRGLA